MLFIDILNASTNKIKDEFQQLFDSVVKNQSHAGDLLLVLVNGFYNPDVHNWTLEEKTSPYMIGPNLDGLSEDLHYKFIHDYRTNGLAKITFEEYLSTIEYSSEHKEHIDKLIELESSTIQLEMLIYLKMWEADAFIKKFYQIVRLIYNEPYDWHFKINESNRDDTATGKRHEIIRLKVRERLKEKFPNLYSSFKTAYLTQIRNSIAHSQYSFLGRNIHPNNFVSNDKSAQLRNLPFNDWILMFHETMVIYNQYIGFKNLIMDYYEQEALKNNNICEIRICRKDPKEYIQYLNLRFRPQYKDWKWDTEPE